MRAVPHLALWAILPFLASCFMITHDYRGARELTPGTVLSQPSSVTGTVQGSKKATFLFFGLIPLNDGSGAQLAEDLAVEKYGGDFDGITRIRIQEQTNGLDVVVNFLVGIVFSMRTVEVGGDVHRFTEGAGR